MGCPICCGDLVPSDASIVEEICKIAILLPWRQKALLRALIHVDILGGYNECTYLTKYGGY